VGGVSETEALKLALAKLGFRYAPLYRTLSGRLIKKYIRPGEDASVKDENDVRWLFPIRVNEMIDTLEYFGAPVRIVYEDRTWRVYAANRVTDDAKLGIALGLMVAKALPPLQDRPLVVPPRELSPARPEGRVAYVLGGWAHVHYEIKPGEVRGYGTPISRLETPASVGGAA
jgi:hypothetical protein